VSTIEIPPTIVEIKKEKKVKKRQSRAALGRQRGEVTRKNKKKVIASLAYDE
jgi:hypothetical protein